MRRWSESWRHRPGHAFYKSRWDTGLLERTLYPTRTWVLTANELFTQRYDLGNVNSVVLYTGGLSEKEIGSTEPFMPIQRAFLTAGARSVTTFLWKLDPSSLSKVLSEIYSDFASQGIIDSQTTQSAQTNLLKQPMTSHPYFWAGIHSLSLTELIYNV